MGRRLEVLPSEMHIDLDKRLFNAIYLPELQTIHNREVYYGGSGSGKSYFVSEKLAIQLTTMPDRNLVCLREQKTDCISSCWSDVKGALSEFKLLSYWEVKENPDHVMFNRINGNQIIFEGVDNIEDIKSIKFYNKVKECRANLTDVWYEEANAEKSIATLRELERRIRDRHIKTRIILSFNPVSRAHWLFDYVTKELPASDLDWFVLKTTYADNAFCSDEYRRLLESYKYTSPYDYQVYTLGNWGTLGQTIFDANKIQLRLNALGSLAFTTGDFLFKMSENKLPDKDSYRFFSNSDGDTAIYSYPKKNYPYVLAIDTAGEGSDYYAGHVCDNITGEQVARFHSRKKPDDCIWQLYGLANMYNEALVCPEINFDTWIVKAFLLLGYPNLYRRMSAEDKTHKQREDRYGWRTGVENRQMMLSDMIYWTGQNMHLINDVDTLNEMLTFTKQEIKLKGIWSGAEPGTHDDLVISFAIWLQARSQQSMELIAARRKLEGYWTREELEDAVEEGSIDRQAAREYIEKFGCYAEGVESAFKPLVRRR